MIPDSNLKGQKILITGGLGFIGSNLAQKCLELGAEVTIYDCLDPNSGGNMFNIYSIKDSVELIFSNILHFDDICKHILNKDILFNCAASTSHSFSMRDPLFNIDVNSKGVINLLEAARRFNPDMKFVHLGTTTQLGKAHYHPADESHPEYPTDIYSANKSVSEKYVLIYGRAYSIPVTVLRLPNVLGPRAAIHSKEFNFVNYFIGLALQNKDLTVFGTGNQMRNLMYIDDCISALIMASQDKKTNNEVFFAVGDEHFSVAEIAQAIVTHMRSGKVKCIEWPKEMGAIEVGDARISNKKIKNSLGWHPKTDLVSGLKNTREYFSSCLEHYLNR